MTNMMFRWSRRRRKKSYNFSLDTREKLLDFFRRRRLKRNIIFVIDQMNALAEDEIEDRRWKRGVRRWLERKWLIFPYFAISMRRDPPERFQSSCIDDVLLRFANA